MLFTLAELTAAELDKLLRFITRHQTSMISSPIPSSGHIPPAFLQCLVELEAGVTDTIATEKVSTKKMAPVKAKALNGMRQTLKKKMKEFEAVLRVYNEASCLDSTASFLRSSDSGRQNLHLNV